MDGIPYCLHRSQEAVRIIKTAAVMQGCKVGMELMGGAVGCENDEELVARIRKVAERQKLLRDILPTGNIGGSEECIYFMERVQKNGGQAAYVMVGTELAAGHHDGFFDFNEEAMVPAIALMSWAVVDLLIRD
jgi:aminobenzoyl-glutamate utilization protein A